MVFVLKVSGELPEVLKPLPSNALDRAVFTNRSYLTSEDAKNRPSARRRGASFRCRTGREVALIPTKL